MPKVVPRRKARSEMAAGDLGSVCVTLDLADDVPTSPLA